MSLQASCHGVLSSTSTTFTPFAFNSSRTLFSASSEILRLNSDAYFPASVRTSCCSGVNLSQASSVMITWIAPKVCPSRIRLGATSGNALD